MIPQLLLRNPQALVTIIVPIAHSIRMEGDKRIIIIHYGEEDEVRKQFAVTGMEELSKFMEMLQDAVINLYPKKLKCQPIYDPLLKRDITLHPIPPTLAFLDISVACTRGVVVCHEYNQELGYKTKLVILFPLGSEHVSWFVHLILNAAPEDRDRIYDERLGENKDYIELPGYPPFYVWEGQLTQPDDFIQILHPVYGSLSYIEAMVHARPGYLGKVYQEEMRKEGHKVLFTGPLLPKQLDDGSQFPDDGGVKRFLDRVLTEKGKNSVFRYTHVPSKPHQLSILLDVLIGLDIRFILAQGVAPVELQLLAKQKILTKDYDDKAMLIPWANQFAVLSHEATGWFLNHGGSNSTMKGLKTEAPIVTAHNPHNVISGTNEAIEKEFKDVFGQLDSEEFGLNIRKDIQRVGNEVDDDEITREGWKELIKM
ncbi:hypothetical protein L486_00339 [Kwoniella mangroviensis CBS 10435]|uniref:UDP-Glycosyltransferase/glycogen phosphorylase n=1 Tax=Kwoniella mangroviensis CBS 10435 TaxID=1331196 RepID=A0A1B9IYU2_9TREE|nr:hypothetical protein L486_00339 [Kwoniella mangroviensis CBS 10435]